MLKNSGHRGKGSRLRTGVIVLLTFVTFWMSACSSSCSRRNRVTVITVNPDGTFTPSNVGIKAGDTVRWVNLTRTDAIVQIGNPASFPSSDLCGINDNDLDHVFASSDANEFTGPTRNAVSGIFALGPNDGPGFQQFASTVVCDCEVAKKDPCSPPQPVTALDGNSYKLCPGQGGNYQALDATWNNPDITGVTLRISWKDLQKDILQPDGTGKIEYYWNDLDREMNQAVAHGKLFTLDIKAGNDGTPPWIFNSYLGSAGPGPIVPVTLKDWGSGPIPDHDNCGYANHPLGSPTDINYRNLYVAMINALAAHVAGDSRWFQALAHVKVSGANFLSSEARLPKRCYDSDDGDDDNGDGILDGDGTLDTIGTDPCICNPQVWANAGYTPAGLHEYYRVVENTIYNAFYKRKSMGYQLIQDGFPKVVSSTNFEGDSLVDKDGIPLLPDPLNSLLPGGNTGDDLNGTIQTETNLQEGRDGRFVDPLGASSDPLAGKLFVPQHSGIGRLPEDDGYPACSQHQAVDPATMKASFPIPAGTPGDGGVGCPNKWAVNEGTLHDQIMGFQTNNAKEVAAPADVESALWNLTINSNGVFIELYEERLWEIFQIRGTGATAPVLDPGRTSLPVGNPTPNPAPFSKNLYTWANELHDRRKQLINAANPNVADPFPTIYEHTFSQPLNWGQTYYYINPSKCVISVDPNDPNKPNPSRVGSISVTP